MNNLREQTAALVELQQSKNYNSEFALVMCGDSWKAVIGNIWADPDGSIEDITGSLEASSDTPEGAVKALTALVAAQPVNPPRGSMVLPPLTGKIVSADGRAVFDFDNGKVVLS